MKAQVDIIIHIQIETPKVIKIVIKIETNIQIEMGKYMGTKVKVYSRPI